MNKNGEVTIKWSEEDKEFVAFLTETPSMSALDSSRVGALIELEIALKGLKS